MASIGDTAVKQTSLTYGNLYDEQILYIYICKAMLAFDKNWKPNDKF